MEQPATRNDRQPETTVKGNGEQNVIRPQFLPTPLTRAERRVLEGLNETHGTAFEVYLEQIWNDVPIINIEEDFLNTYLDSYDSINERVTEFLESVGWNEALTHFCHTQGIPEGALSWSVPALADFFTEDFYIFEEHGRIYVFYK